MALDAEMILEDLGMEVSASCDTLASGLDAARTMGFDVALLDVNLRDEKSFPIADVLVERNIPFAFVTGYDTLGWDGHAPKLDKPYEEDGIKRVLHALLAPNG